MIFNSISFLIFFPIVILLHYLLPHRYRYIVLLFASYIFYMSAEPYCVIFLITTTLITWVSGNLLYKLEDAGQKYILALGICLSLGLLIFFKYTNFILSLIKSDSSLSLLLPLGISFYTFQSITYMVDCYRKELKPEKNILKYALFVSFFPCILSGPIERAKDFLPQIDVKKEFDTLRAKKGLCLMLWGYFLKMVIVSRLTILCDLVFSDYNSFSGSMLMLATLAYAILIYCDFYGYSSIAIGAAKILGFKVRDNFRQPYLAVSIQDFWRRWHISLSTWFRDYLYIPLGGNKLGKARKYINIMIVFILSGLWHGANMTFILWGALNGIYQILGSLLLPLKENFFKITGIYKNENLKRRLQILVTFILITLTWVFFRASSIGEAFDILKLIFTNFKAYDLINGRVFSLGLGIFNLLFVVFAIGILILCDLICESKKIGPSSILDNVRTPIRYLIYEMLFIMILFSCTLSTQEFLYQGF